MKKVQVDNRPFEHSFETDCWVSLQNYDIVWEKFILLDAEDQAEVSCSL